jgi:hypothetical protein
VPHFQHKVVKKQYASPQKLTSLFAKIIAGLNLKFWCANKEYSLTQKMD